MPKCVERGLEPPVYQARLHLARPRSPIPTSPAPACCARSPTLGYAGGYTAVKEILRDLQPALSAGFEIRYETSAGRQALVDFAIFRTVSTDKRSIERVVWLSPFSPRCAAADPSAAGIGTGVEDEHQAVDDLENFRPGIIAAALGRGISRMSAHSSSVRSLG